MNIDSIMQNLEDKVIRNEPISPIYWVESALRINQLAFDLENEIAAIESELNNVTAELIKQDLPENKSKILARSKIDYKSYLEKKAKIKRIDEFIKLAKRRSTLDDKLN